MRDFDSLFSWEGSSPKVQTRSHPLTCRVGNIFILNQDSKGIFKQISSGWGRHFTLVAGGLASVGVVVDSSQAGAKNVRDSSASAEVQPVSNGESRGIQQRKSYDCIATTDYCLETPQCSNKEEHLCPQNDSEPCVRVYVDAVRQTNPRTAGRGETDATISKVSCVPQTIVKRRCDTESEDRLPTQMLLRLGNSGIESSSELRFTRPSQDCSSVSAYASNSAEPHMSSTSPPPRIVQISVGASHTLACDAAGSLYSWEDSQFTAGPRRRRKQREFCPVLALGRHRVVGACAGDHYSLAVTDKGDVYSWGVAYSGQLGRVVEEVAPAPRFVASLMRTFITGLSCNETHVIAYSQHGECFSWGSNDCGQLGLGVRSSPQAHPQRILFKAKIASQKRRPRSTITVRRPCEGSEGEKGQYRPVASTQGALHVRPCQASVVGRDLGFCDEVHKTEADSSSATGATAYCELLDAVTFIVAVAAGWRHSLALAANGDVYSWGLNTAGQLGVGHCQSCYAPVLVQEYDYDLKVLRKRDSMTKGPDCWSACTLMAGALEVVFDDCSRCHGETPKCTGCELCQTWSCRRHKAAHSRQLRKRHDEEGGRESFAQGRGGSSDNWGSTDYQTCFTAEACNWPQATQKGDNGKEDAQTYLRLTDSDSRPSHTSILGVVKGKVQASRDASLSEPGCADDELQFQDSSVMSNVGKKFNVHGTCLQICAGQLFSAFLSSDGRVFLAGQSPSTKQVAGCGHLVDRTQCNHGTDTGGPSRSFIPASVPGLEAVVVTEIACSKHALVAFVPCQVLRVHPSLVPLSPPKGPSINLRVTITVSPDTFSSFMPSEHEADGLSEGGTIDHDHNASKQTEFAAQGDNGFVGKECFCFRSESYYSAAYTEGHHTEPSAHDCQAEEVVIGETNVHDITTVKGADRFAASAREKTALASRNAVRSVGQASEAFKATLDSELSNKNRPMQEYEERDVLVRFRSLAPHLLSVFSTPREPPVVKGRWVERVADKQMAAVEIDCTCPTLLHCSTDGASTFEKDCAKVPRDTSNVPPWHGDARVSPSLEIGDFSTDSRPVGSDCLGGQQSHAGSLPEASYFRPETPREEVAIRAYHEAKRFLQSQQVQVLPYAVEVSVDGGCCWSNAEFNKSAASVLFARFPETIVAVCPNNVTTKGGLTLSIFLDYIPSGIPEENIVVKFTCIHKYQGAAFPDSCTLHLKEKPPSDRSTPSHTSAAAFSKPEPSQHKRIEEKADRGMFDMGNTQQYCNRGQSFHQPALCCQAEMDGGPGSKPEVEEDVRPEVSAQDLKEHNHVTRGSSSSAGVGSVAQTSCAPVMLPCGARGENQDHCYYVLVPARVVGEKCGSEIPHRTITQKLALQCSSPALDGSAAADFDLFLDVALNGVNFTGKPLPIRVLEANIVELVPNVGYSRCDTKVYIRTREHCDSSETVVLLKHDDGSQQVVPVRVETETHQLYFIMPKRRSLTPPPAEDVPNMLEINESCTDKSESSGKPLVEGTTRMDYKRDAAPGLSAKCSTTRGPDEPVNRNNAETRSFPISVHLSFNGQAFSHSGKIFLHYDSEPVVMGVLAYTTAEGGELFEADIENVIVPGTTIVIYLQSAVATHNAQARLTVLKSSFTCSHTLFTQLTSAGVCDMDISAMQQEGRMAPPPEAVERIILLPAALDMEPQRIVLQTEHTRVKKKSPALRGALADTGGKGKFAAESAAGNGGTANIGAIASSKRNAGGIMYPGGGGAPAESSSASSRLKGKAVAGSPGGFAVAVTSGTSSTVAAPGNKTSGKKLETPSDLNDRLDAEEGKTNGPTLTVTVPAITLDPQQSDTSIADVCFAFAEISLDGQHFIPMKQWPLLRLKCKWKPAHSPAQLPNSQTSQSLLLPFATVRSAVKRIPQGE